MKKIITSVGMIVFVGALVVGGTGAFFSDTETSTGNVFTAGAIDLKIDSEQHYNNAVCVVDGEVSTWQLAQGAVLEVPQYPVIGSECDGTWSLTDLENGVHKFFNFNDVKPGDEGENTISIHIDSNPSWMCADIAVTSNDDVTCNEPELGDDATCAEPDADEFDGDLAQNLNIFTWLDDGAVDGFQNSDLDENNNDAEEGDNIWQAGENPLFSNGVGPLSDAIGGENYALADSNTPFGPLPPGLTQYIGLAWCAGTLDISVPGNLDCDGTLMNNAAQTDEALVDITFRVEQARNNEDFTCAPQEPEVLPATLTIDKVVGFSSTEVIGVDVTDFELTIDGPVAGTGDAQIVVDQVATPNLPAGTYTISEIYSNVPAGVVFNATFSGACSEIGDTGVGTLDLVAGSNVTCTITNIVDPLPPQQP